MTPVLETVKLHSDRATANLQPANSPLILINESYDLSSVNHATITPLLIPHLSQLLWSSESASAARTQRLGVDRVRLGPGETDASRCAGMTRWR
jgi:hypothetical protein